MIVVSAANTRTISRKSSKASKHDNFNQSWQHDPLQWLLTRRQILTSELYPRTEKVSKIYNGMQTHSIGIQMKQKELTKTFMMISNLQKNKIWSQWFTQKYVLVVSVITTSFVIRKRICVHLKSPLTIT